MQNFFHISNQHKGLKLFCLILISTNFLWLIISKTATESFSRDFPELAVYLNPSISSITLDAADQILGQSLINKNENNSIKEQDSIIKDKKALSQAKNALPTLSNNLIEVRKKLISLLQREPTNATAFRLLGQIAALENEPKLSGRMMFQSTQLSLHDPIALYDMLSRSINSHNYLSVIYYADAFLRGYPSSIGIIAPIMMELMTNDQARTLLVKTLESNPPWRSIVLNAPYSTAGLKDIQAPLRLLTALNETASPVQLKELVGYLNFLFQNQQYELAYSTWLLFIPAELMDQTGLVFNGSFETDPTGLFFDWSIGKGSEVEVSITGHPDNDASRVLFVEFGLGRTKFPMVRQTLLLTPGNYRLSYLVKGEIRARRGLAWQIICENGKQAGEDKTVIGRFQNWQRMNSEITIPKEGCRYQYLRLVHLARSSSEQMASGQLWFDELSIERQNDASSLNP